MEKECSNVWFCFKKRRRERFFKYVENLIKLRVAPEKEMGRKKKSRERRRLIEKVEWACPGRIYKLSFRLDLKVRGENQ